MSHAEPVKTTEHAAMSESSFESPSTQMKSASPPPFSLTAGDEGNKGFGGGYAPNGREKNIFVGGRTIGETIGDVTRPVGTALGNVVGGVAGALSGISISSNTRQAAAHNPNGDFSWVIGFNTSGRSGWIVQEIKNQYRAEDAAGQALPGMPTAQYYEAWQVDAAGTVNPGPDNDYWLRPDRGANTKGHWSMEGKVYWTTTDPATQGFAVGNAGDAGALISSLNKPADLGVARLHRYAQGHWDSTGAAPYHKGSAH